MNLTMDEWMLILQGMFFAFVLSESILIFRVFLSEGKGRENESRQEGSWLEDFHARLRRLPLYIGMWLLILPVILKINKNGDSAYQMLLVIAAALLSAQCVESLNLFKSK